MNLLARRSFLGGLGLGTLSVPSLSKLFAQTKNSPDRFRIGIQEYTFHRWLNSGKLTHLDTRLSARTSSESKAWNIGVGLSEVSILTGLMSGK